MELICFSVQSSLVLSTAPQTFFSRRKSFSRIQLYKFLHFLFRLRRRLCPNLPWPARSSHLPPKDIRLNRHGFLSFLHASASHFLANRPSITVHIVLYAAQRGSFSAAFICNPVCCLALKYLLFGADGLALSFAPKLDTV